ncbi:MAG: NAD(P)H-hydrate dehydratase [Candidatus Margulisiibacteriota bacterium]
MEPISAAKMAEIDRRAIQELGIPQRTLMENAGLKVFEVVTQLWGYPKKVCAVCGKGNNGGDAKIAAEHFKNAGSAVSVVSVESENTAVLLESALQDCDLVIDGLFGTGLKNAVNGENAKLIQFMNEVKIVKNNHGRQNYRIVSVDIPSGLDADTGESKGACVNADLTVSFHAVKAGLLTPNGINRAGRIVVADIGIPYETGQFSTKNGISFADPSFVKRTLLLRKTYSNKSDNGRVLLIAGSVSMAGAAVLCARSSIRAGAGLVYLSVPKPLQNHVNIAIPEAITLADISLPEIKKLKLSAVAIGPGIGLKKKALLKSLLKAGFSAPMVLDADALNLLALEPSVLNNYQASLVITPHPGELARLLGSTVASIQKDRIAAVRKAASAFNAVVVLKGLNTVVSDPSGRCCIVSAGNPAMACGGTGDALTGIITALIGQGADPYEASVSGAFIHGMSADIVRSVKGETGVSSSDIIEAVPYLIKGCCDGKQKDR